MNTLFSHRGARRAAIAAAAVSVSLLTAGCGTSRPTAGASPAQPVAAVSPAGSTAQGAGVRTVAVARPPGVLYYVDADDRLLRLTPAGPVTVLKTGGLTANVSPDGRSIAYIASPNDDNIGNVIVTDRNGKHARTVFRGTIDAGWEPAWSPDSTRLLVARGPADRPVLGTVDVRTTTFTALPHQPGGMHHLWSADGRQIGYATGECRIGVAAADGGRARLVPGIGEQNRTTNPRNRFSCDPYSISPDGSRMAVAMRTGDDPAGDIARDLAADTVIDTRTGVPVALPVRGTVSAVLFDADNGMVIRSTANGRTTLTLVSATGAVTAQTAEPTAVQNLSLVAHAPA